MIMNTEQGVATPCSSVLWNGSEPEQHNARERLWAKTGYLRVSNI
jgi:hypothetical protein